MYGRPMEALPPLAASTFVMRWKTLQPFANAQ